MTPFENSKQITQAPSERKILKVKELVWEASEYIYYRKSPDWYWALGVITLALLIIAYLSGNFLFGALVVIGAFTVLLYGARRPNIATFKLTGAGVQIDDRLFPYDGLKSFWIFYHPGGVKELSLASEKVLVSYLKIPLGDMNPNDVRSFLLQFLPEKAQEESWIDIITHYLRF